MDATACLDADTLAAYVDGRLTTVELGLADRHIDECRSCRGELSVIAAVQTAKTGGGAPAQLPEDRFGRYIVMRELGHGAMGSVVRAYDPELARAVAVKVLHEVDARASERLRSEAQAMARLAHPNVVTVYDVVADGDLVFVAMELIDGQMLRQFAVGKPWREILDACIAAGRGLAAAHAAKLVHRDFKPENVLCGDDGRVAVSDFGLARSLDDVADDAHIAGTPAYMAPELYRGEPATPASDQFAFAATTYEMLYDQRVFPGADLRELRAAILAGDVREPPAGRGIPARVWTVLSRGLARDPAERFASLTELLDALADDPIARRRRRIVQATALVAAVAVGAVVVRAVGGTQPSCELSAKELDGAWDQPRRAGLAAGLAAVKGDVARTTAALDAYTGRWLAARRDACEATHVRGTASQRVLDARVACLDRARRELAALTDLFAHADRAVADRAVEAVFRLPDPAACSFDRQASPALPQRAELDRARALFSVGKEADADIIASRVLASLPPGFAPQLVAEALQLRARAANRASPARGENYLYQALTAAERAGNDQLAANVWIDLLATMGGAARFDASQIAARAVEARFARFDPSPAMRLRYELSLGASLLTHGSLAAAREHLERALALSDTGVDTRIDVLSHLCLLETRDHRYDRANKVCADALKLVETSFGPDHPRVATLLNTIGGLEEEQHHVTEGEKAFARAAAILERSGHQDYLDYALAIVNLGLAAAQRSDFARAVPLYERARDLFAKDHPKDPNRLLALQGLADAAQHTGDVDGAIRMFEEARATAETIYAKESKEVLAATFNLGLAYLDRRQLAEAEARFDDVLAGAARGGSTALDGAALALKAEVADARGDRRAAIALRVRAIAVSDRGPNPLDGDLARVMLARDYLALGQAAEAIAPLEHAVAAFAQIPELADETARARFLLARALWQSGRDRPRARKLAQEAQRALATSTTTMTGTKWSVPALRREVTTWLARAGR